MQVEVLITANTAGDLAYLPRLYTALRELKTNCTGKVLLVDTGRAWSAQEWVCQATENRAPYLVMDAMGYDFIFADGLTPEAQERLRGQVLAVLAAAEAAYRFENRGLLLVSDPALSEPQLEGDRLRLPLPPKTVIGEVSLDLGIDSAWTITAVAWHHVPAATLPDPTIAGTVDFVISEARYYQKKRSTPS